jgi:hypothetical protein
MPLVAEARYYFRIADDTSRNSFLSEHGACDLAHATPKTDVQTAISACCAGQGRQIRALGWLRFRRSRRGLGCASQCGLHNSRGYCGSSGTLPPVMSINTFQKSTVMS